MLNFPRYSVTFSLDTNVTWKNCQCRYVAITRAAELAVIQTTQNMLIQNSWKINNNIQRFTRHPKIGFESLDNKYYIIIMTVYSAIYFFCKNIQIILNGFENVDVIKMLKENK